VTEENNNIIRKGVLLSVSSSPPEIQAVVQTNGLITLTWNSTTGQVYQVQYSLDLGPTNWVDLGPNLVATNGTMSTSDTLGVDAQRFYRVVLLH
jgi:hypothetical protein